MLEARIPTIDIDRIADIKRAFERYVDPALLEGYRLQTKSNLTRVIVGVSGGADSSVLALFAAAYLSPHYPNIELLFTDTGNEPKSCHETLDKIERMTGFSIHRIKPDKGLFELIDQYNGFLPNSKARWCTRQLKVDPLLEYMGQADNGHGYISLAGIRFDEADREGITFAYTMEDASAQFPFVDLKITRETVFSLLNDTVGIPSTYQYRSRSGCQSCFFQRNSEIVGFLNHDPEGFMATEKLEKLSDADQARWEHVPEAPIDVGISVLYPVPAFIDIRKPDIAPEKAPPKSKKAADSGMADLFDNTAFEPEQLGDELFTAVALYTNKSLGLYGDSEFTPGVYWQEFISFSTSLAGIKSALGTYHKFRTTTPMPQYDVNDLQIVISQIRFPEGTIDLAPPDKSSFTWKANVAYKQLRNLAAHCENTLGYVALEREYDDALAALNGAGNQDAYMLADERFESIASYIATVPEPTGKLVWEGLYVPTKDSASSVQMELAGVSVETMPKIARENIEFDEVPRACVVCSF